MHRADLHMLLWGHSKQATHIWGCSLEKKKKGEKEKEKKKRNEADTQKLFNLSPKHRGDLLQMHGSFSSTKMDSALEPGGREHS